MLINFFFFVCAYLVLASSIFYFYNLGHILTKKVFFEKTSISINIILGFGIFISFINLIYLTEFGNFKYLLLFLLIHILFLFSKNLKYKFNFKFYCLIILSIIFSLAVFNHQYSNHDDVNGYFNIYSNIISDNYKLSPELNLRSFYSSLGYNFIQSVFIFLGGYTSTYFFDQSFGCILMLIFFYEKFQRKLPNSEFFFFIIFLSLSCLTLSETSMPKVILTSLSLILLDQLKKFYEGSENLLIISAILLIAYNLRFNFLISFVCFIFIFILILKFYKNFFFFKKNLKVYFFIIIFCYFNLVLQKLYVFDTISPIFGSKYYITNNSFFKEIIFVDLIENNILFFWFKVFLKKHLIFILFLLLLFFLIRKNIFFYLIILISYFFSIIIFSYIQFPDFANPKRYLHPLENSLIIFLLINLWKYVDNSIKQNLIHNKFKYFYFVVFAIISINLSLSSHNIIFLKKLYFDRLESVKYIFLPKQITEKPFFYKSVIFSKKNNEDYVKNINYCLKNKKFEGETLVLVKHAYLIESKKIQVIDYLYGFTFSKKMYPIFQSFDYQSKHFNENYNQILIEKASLNSSNIIQYIQDYEKRKVDNVFSLKNFYTYYSKMDLYPVIAWLDFAKYLNKFIELKPQSIICENKDFFLLKF